MLTRLFHNSQAPEAAITGVARNGLNALELLGPKPSQCLRRAKATPMKGVRFMLAQGDEEKFIAEEKSPDHGTPTLSLVHTAPFLKELLACIPPERLHPLKRLERVERKDDDSPVVLFFADGSTHECDILVGTDGIDSAVRKFVHGNDPAASPRNTGAWAVITQKHGAEAMKLFGDDLKENHESAWIGQGVFLEPSWFNLTGTQILNVIIASHDSKAESSDSRRRTVRLDELKELFKNWPMRLRKAVDEVCEYIATQTSRRIFLRILVFCLKGHAHSLQHRSDCVSSLIRGVQLLGDQTELPAMYLWEHPPVRTYVSGSVCVVGDAAHAAAPWQGVSGGMMIEDVAVLSTLLGQATSTAEAVTALEIYDGIRRPRTQQIVESSRETGTYLTGRGKETGMDLERLQEKLLPRWDFIVNFDVGDHINDARQRLNNKLKRD